MGTGVTASRRAEVNFVSASDKGMNASEAVRRGFIVANDNDPEADNAPSPFAAFAQIQEHISVGAKTSFCPKMTGKNSICDGNAPCDVRNLAYVTALNAENLPSKMLDKADPYVWFWVENKKNVASTPEYNNNENPHFDWGCPFAYDGALNFDGEVWDSNIGADRLTGEIASSGGIKIDEKFLQEFDKNGDGRFELGLFIYKNGKKVKNKKKGKDAIVRFRFELIKAPGYELRRIEYTRGGSYGGSRGEQNIAEY